MRSWRTAAEISYFTVSSANLFLHRPFPFLPHFKSLSCLLACLLASFLSFFLSLVIFTCKCPYAVQSRYLCRRQWGYIMPDVCLFVCLSVTATLRWKTERIFKKILPQMYKWTRKNWLNSVSYPLRDPDAKMFWRLLQQCEVGNFSTIWPISLEKLLGFSCKFYYKCSFGQGSSR